MNRPAVPTQLRGRLFLTVADVAALTDTDPRTVRRGIDQGQIQALKVNSTIRIPAAPFWVLCGLDPTTLLPATADAGETPHAEHEASPARTGLVDITPAEESRHGQGCA